MSGGKGGSSPSTAEMERVARESNQLQERIYDESVDRAQPFYDTGVTALGTLSDYLGLGGGAGSMQSRDQIRSDLLPQYTSQMTTAGATPQYSNQELNSLISFGKARGFNFDETTPEGIQEGMQMARAVGYDGGMPTPQSTTTDSIDYTGLNAAIDAQLASQGADRPDYFGSLLTPFSQTDWQQDPGYQFRQEEAQKAVERNLAAQGQTLNPRVQQALQEQSQNLASQEYGNAFNRYNIEQNNVFNRLANIAGVGQTSSQQLDQLGQNFAQNVSSTNTSLANAQAAAQQAAASNNSSMFGNLLSLGGTIAGGMIGGPAGATAGGMLGGGATGYNPGPITWNSGRQF